MFATGFGGQLSKNSTSWIRENEINSRTVWDNWLKFRNGVDFQALVGGICIIIQNIKILQYFLWYSPSEQCQFSLIYEIY